MDSVIIAKRQENGTYHIEVNEYGVSFLEQAVTTLNKKRDTARKYARGSSATTTRTAMPRIGIVRQ